MKENNQRRSVAIKRWHQRQRKHLASINDGESQHESSNQAARGARK